MARNIRLLAVFNFLTDFKFHSAILVIYFAQVTGSYAQAMSLFALTYLSNALFEIPTGIFSDRVGRKTTIALGALASAVSMILYASAPSFPLLAAGAVFEGVSRAFYSGNNDAFLYDTLASVGRKSEFGLYLGRVGAMFQVALAVASTTGSIMAERSFALVMWLTVIPQVLCFLMSFLFTEPPRVKLKAGNVFSHLAEAISLVRSNGLLRLLTATDVLSTGIGEATFTFRSAFIATLWPMWAVGLAKTLAFAGAALSFWVSGRIIKRFSEPLVLIASRCYNLAANVTASYFPTVFSPALLSSTSLTYGAVRVSTNSLFHAEYSSTERATLASLTSLLSSLCFSLFAVVLGYVADLWDTRTALLVAAAASVPNIFILGLLVQYKRYDHTRDRNLM